MILQLWKEAVDKKEVFSTLMTDLSKAFDCLSHRLYGYGLQLTSFKLLEDYL